MTSTDCCWAISVEARPSFVDGVDCTGARLSDEAEIGLNLRLTVHSLWQDCYFLSLAGGYSPEI